MNPTINSPVASKINWLAILSAAASVLAVFGIDMPTEQKLAIVGGIQALQSVGTVIFRSFMTAK